jgi:sugar/nucleoside kinase (ribokinase family)
MLACVADWLGAAERETEEGMPGFDVYSYGVVSSSTLHVLAQRFPAPEGYAEIAETFTMTGGEATNASLVLATLGLRVRLDGNWIGDNAQGRALLQLLRARGLDVSRLRVKKGYGGVREVVFSDNQGRTIFGNYVALIGTTRQWNRPCKVDLARAQVANIDPYFVPDSVEAVRLAQAVGTPYVTVDCAHNHELTAGAAAVVISREFRAREYPKADVGELLMAYLGQSRGLVVFTDGGSDVLYGRPGQRARRLSPPRLAVVDTTGAGDAFRAGVCVGLLRGWEDEPTVRYAAALAALVCTRAPGVLNAPGETEVLALLGATAPA